MGKSQSTSMPEAGSRGVNQSEKLVGECHCETGTIFKSNFEENFLSLISR